MDMEMDMFQVAEMQDALDTCDELRTVLARLKRLGLLTPEENRDIGQNLKAISTRLAEKLPDEDETETN